LAVGCMFLVRQWIDDLIDRGKGIDLLQPFSIGSSDVLLACVIVGGLAVLLSTLSSLVATRRFLDV
ncbi:MAG: hypothetical protein U0P45_14450, partial [Acidimicrobiales bacterium]